jgi:hypothetical protein
MAPDPTDGKTIETAQEKAERGVQKGPAAEAQALAGHGFLSRW